MSYVEQMERAIEEIKDFDEIIDTKISKIVEVINELDLEGLHKETDSKQVTAHKNRALRVINRVVDKFARDVDMYLSKYMNNEEINEEINNVEVSE